MKRKNVLLGITGGIATYKACSLVNLLIKAGADVKVIMTEAATKFVCSLTFQTLTNHAVYVDMFNSTNKEDVEHISLAKWADIMVIAPITANTISKIAYGIADNLLTTVVMALPQKTHVLLAPAMNVEMWNNPIIQNNVELLKKYKKYLFVYPEKGILACRDEGVGKIADNQLIVTEIRNLLK